MDNILITNDNHCKLADFGLVFDLSNSPRSRAIEGDSRYLAPELMQGNYCLANDIFSLGITLLELSCSLELPTNGRLWQELRSSVLPETAMNSLSPELQLVIRSMMEPNPAKRPTVKQLLKNKKLLVINCQRKMDRISHNCVSSSVNLAQSTDVCTKVSAPSFVTISLHFQKQTFTSGLQLIKWYLLFIVLRVYDFFKLEKTERILTTPSRSKIRIRLNDYEEDSDDGDTSIKTSLNLSRVSKISHTDDDNNNESVTPTLNNSIPRVTPEIKIVNSTPLNHYNHQDGLSNRKYRRDLTKLR